MTEEVEDGVDKIKEEKEEVANPDESVASLTKILIDKNRSLLEDNDIDIEIFQSLDIEEQYDVVDQL